MSKKYNRFFNWLHKPYPYREELDFQIFAPLIIGFAVFLVFYILKPFGFGDMPYHNYFFLGLGIITTVIVWLFLFLIAPISPVYFSNKTWTVKKEILTLFILILIIGSTAWLLYLFVFNTYDKNHYSYTDFLKYTFSTGLFLNVVYVYLNEFFMRSNRENISKEVKEQLNFKTKKQSKNEITLFSSKRKDSINFMIYDLLYITSEGNYASFYIKNDDDITEKVLRIQLKVAENELKNHKEIIRCHKSFIINSDYVTSVTGNAKGYFLHLSQYDIIIPVSRKFTKDELEKLIT